MALGCPSEIHRTPTPAPLFRFLALPGELQNHIVREFIVSDTPLRIHEPQFNRHAPPPPLPPPRPRYDRPVPSTPSLAPLPHPHRSDGSGHTRLALLMTCRKLYAEHWQTYYGDNKFDFNLDVFGRFTRAVPRRCIWNLRRLKFRMPHRHYHRHLWAMFGSLPRLEELELCLKAGARVDETVEDCCIGGIRQCQGLKTFIISRHEDARGQNDSEELQARDKFLEDKVRAGLKLRSDRRSASSECAQEYLETERKPSAGRRIGSRKTRPN